MVDPSSPLELEAEFLEGSGELALNMSLICCEAEQDQVCLIERLRFEAPLRVNGGAAADPASNVVVLRHRVDLPGL